MTMMLVMEGADCSVNTTMCEAFLGKKCVANEACASSGGPTSFPDAAMAPFLSSSPSSLVAGGVEDEEYSVRCLLALGAIGAAHQAGYSKGYSPTCPDTPGEGSPYM